MRASVASISKKIISTFFAATLAVGLVPAAAFAVDDGAVAPENSGGANAPSNIQAEAEASAYEDQQATGNSQDESVEREPAPSNGEGTIEDNVVSFDDLNLAIPAASERINQDMTLQTRTVAQAESTRSYFLAQTLESTRTIPMVSASVPLDTGADVVEPEGETTEEGEGEESDESDLPVAPIAADSTVIGAFEYSGLTFAIEPGGESVALMAVDYAKLPGTFLEKKAIAIPSIVTPDEVDYYSVTRIAADAFSSLILENSESAPRVISTEASDSERSGEISSPEDITDRESFESHLNTLPGIAIMGIPASVFLIEDGAFAGADSLHYVVVEDGSAIYSSYDGVLYNVDQTNLLLVPEGRQGAVRIAPSAVNFEPEAFSHCPSVDEFIADVDSAAYAALTAGNAEIPNRIAITEGDATDVNRYALLAIFPESDLSSGAALFSTERSTYGALRLTKTVTAVVPSSFRCGWNDDEGGEHPYNCSESSTHPPGIMKHYGQITFTFAAGAYVFNCPVNGWMVYTGYPQYHFGSATINGITCTNPYQIIEAQNPKYTVTWNATGGEGAEPTTLESGATHSAPPVSLTGWTCTGWYDADGNKICDDEGTVEDVKASVTYFAHWQRDNDFWPQNGSNDKQTMLATRDETEMAGEFETPAKPTRENWDFLGWTAPSTGTDYVAENTPVTGNATKDWYARWQMTLVLDPNGGTIADSEEPVEESILNYGESPFDSVATTVTKPLKTGYTFQGWKRSANGTGSALMGSRLDTGVATDDATTIPDNALTGHTKLFADWSVNTHSVAWNSNGGAFSYATQNVDYNSTVAVKGDPGGKAGYDFEGWNAVGAPSTFYTAGATFPMPDNDVAMTAKWTPHKNATFWIDRGETAAIEQAEFDSNVTMKSRTVPPGWIFKGWTASTESDATVREAGDTTFVMPDEPVVFTAVWEPIPYTITVNLGAAQTDIEGPVYIVSGDGNGLTAPKWAISNRTATAQYDVSMGRITLPTFAIDGYAAKWTVTTGLDENASFVAGFGEGELNNSLYFSLVWVEIPYQIVFENVGHVGEKGAISGFPATVPFTKVEVMKDGFSYSIGKLVTSNSANAASAYGTFDTERYRKFSGWRVERTDSAAGGARVLVASGDEIDITSSLFGEKDTLYVTASFELEPYTLTLDANEGTWQSAPGNGWIESAEGRFGRPYTCESGRIALPMSGIVRYGYTLSGWTIQDTDANKAVKPDVVQGAYYVPADSIHSLLATAVWMPTTSKLMFSTGAVDALVNEATYPFTADRALSATFGKQSNGAPVLPRSERIDGVTYEVQVPVREGYEFLGYFDDAGRQYYSESLRAVRTWDKEPTAAPFVLVARWQADEAAEDPAAPMKVVAKDTDPTYLKICVPRHNGIDMEPIIEAPYNGLMQWTSTGSRPAADDTVVIDVASIIRTESADAFYTRMRSAFDYGTQHLIGFEVGSSGGFVALQSLAEGSLFSLTLKGSDLLWEQTGRYSEPADAWIATDRIVPVYSDQAPGTGSKLVTGEEVMIMYDAGQGSFDNGRILSVRTVVESPTATPVNVPSAIPVWPGRDFLGWSAVPQVSHTTSGCAHFTKDEGVKPVLTSRVPVTYYAHWAPTTYSVVFDMNYDGGKTYTTSATYGQKPNGLSDREASEAKSAREDYSLLGFFDTPNTVGGTMLFDRNGAARVEAWTITDAAPRVWARWVGGSVENPDPYGPHVFLAENAPIRFAMGSVNVLLGYYDGAFRFDVMGDANRPASGASVRVSVSAYTPSGATDAAARKAALKRVESQIEAFAAGKAEHYLQGFRIASTGGFISWGAIVEGRAFDIDCMGSDFTWNATYNTPPAANITGGVTAVYGTSPAYPPYESGEDIVVVNVFDAGAGAFPGTGGKRYLDVKSKVGSVVTVPSTTSDLAGANPEYRKNEGYRFTGWVDENGHAPTTQTSTESHTFYAAYLQETSTIEFHIDSEATSIANYEADDIVGETRGNVSPGSPYVGQTFADVHYPLPVTDSTFWREGYDFLGWFSEDGASAYYLTAAGRAYYGDAAKDMLVQGSVEKNVDYDMYALWAAKTYQLNWHWNYPDYKMGEKVYPGTRNDADADVFPASQSVRSVRYGQLFEVPAIEQDERRFEYAGWFTARDVDLANVGDRDEKSVRNDLKSTGGKTFFVPSASHALTPTIDYYAAWDASAGPIPHTIMLWPGDHGVYDGGKQPIPLPYDFTMKVLLSPEPTSEAGWKPSGWVEASSAGAAVGIEEVTEVAAGTTGDLNFIMTWTHAEYTLTLSGLEVVSKWDRPEQWQESTTLPFDLDTPAMTFPGADVMGKAIGKRGYVFTGWSATPDGSTPVVTGFDPKEYIQDGSSSDQLTYYAIWQPLTYTVVFETVALEKAEDTRNTVIKVLTYGDDVNVEVPMPTIREGRGGVFRHWGTTHYDPSNIWTAESVLPLSTLVGKYTGSIQARKTLSGVVNGEYVENREFENVITVCGVWAHRESADVPLTVDIVIDPETGDSMVSDAWLSTTCSQPVKVMGLTYDKTKNAGEVLGTDEVFDEHIGLASLTLTATKQRSDAVTKMTIPLKTPKTFSGDAVAGFEAFGKDARLDIVYGLNFDLTSVSGATESEKLTKVLQAINLPDKNDIGDVSNHSRLSFPIAKLYYTLGLAEQE